MNKLLTLTSAVGIGLATAHTAMAAETSAFSGAGEFGYSDSSGNTDSTSLFAALNLAYSLDLYEFTAGLEANYQTENSQTTSERYLLDLQGKRFFNTEKSFYGFAGARFDQNKFEDIDLDSTYSLGLGKVLYQSKATKLKGEAGLGYQNINYSTAAASQSQAVATAKLDFSHQINEQVAFTQDALYITGSDQSKFESNTGFKVKVAKQMNLKAAYKYRHNDQPLGNNKKVDTLTTLTLIYDF